MRTNKTNRQILVSKTLQRELKIDQHESDLKSDENVGAQSVSISCYTSDTCSVTGYMGYTSRRNTKETHNTVCVGHQYVSNEHK